MKKKKYSFAESIGDQSKTEAFLSVCFRGIQWNALHDTTGFSRIGYRRPSET